MIVRIAKRVVSVVFPRPKFILSRVSPVVDTSRRMSPHVDVTVHQVEALVAKRESGESSIFKRIPALPPQR